MTLNLAKPGGLNFPSSLHLATSSDIKNPPRRPIRLFAVRIQLSTSPEMPPLPLIPSSFAICLRCQFRYSHRLQLPRRMALPQMRLRSVAFFTTTPLLKANASSSRELVILEPPGPRVSLHRYAPPPRDLDDTDLGSGIQQLLTFEFKDQDVLDATHIGILLCKPHVTKVSKERYEQIFMEINHAFLRPQLLEYYSKSMRVGKGRPSALSKAPKKGELLHEIMRNMWGIEVTDEIAEREDVLMNEEIKSNRRDIFFMIGEGKYMLVVFLEKEKDIRMGVCIWH